MQSDAWEAYERPPSPIRSGREIAGAVNLLGESPRGIVLGEGSASRSVLERRTTAPGTWGGRRRPMLNAGMERPRCISHVQAEKRGVTKNKKKTEPQGGGERGRTSSRECDCRWPMPTSRPIYFDYIKRTPARRDNRRHP